ncbi:MAG: hypothetical protein WA210_00770 [Burkholderiaceae bacterium]
MGLEIKQFHRFVVQPALAHIGLAGIDAERLVVGTGLTESQLAFIDQKGRGGETGWGPALGLFQMEKRTFDDHVLWLRTRQVGLWAKVESWTWKSEAFPSLWHQLAGNLPFAAAMCRIHYYRAPEKLPSTLDGMAQIYKLRYNSPLGAATEQDFKSRAAPVMTLVQPLA